MVVVTPSNKKLIKMLVVVACFSLFNLVGTVITVVRPGTEVNPKTLLETIPLFLGFSLAYTGELPSLSPSKILFR